MRARLLFPFLLLFLMPFPLWAEEWFDLEVKVLTTGENQAQKDIAAFGAELPSGGKGNLDKSVTIKNQTRKKVNDIDFKITFTPQRAESGELHVIFTSEATPRIGKIETRFRDLRFDNPGDQIVGIFADPETGTHLLIAVSIKAKETAAEIVKELKVVFKCKVEKIAGGTKELIDSYDLQSVAGAPVKRTLTQQVPVWVEGDQGEVAATGFKEVGASSEPVYLKAGEGFTYTPSKKTQKELKKGKKKADAKMKKLDTRLPASAQKEEDKLEEESTKPVPKPEPPLEETKPPISGSYNWEKEEITYEILNIEAVKGSIKSTVKLTGVLYDPAAKLIEPLEPKEESHIFANGEMAAFSLVDPSGTGYILTIQPFF